MSTKSTPAVTEKPKKGGILSFLINFYMVAYNLAMCGGWAYICFLTVMNYVEKKSAESVYPAVRLPLIIFQTGAFLEIFHAMFGFVRSPIFTTFSQVFSRLFILWAILEIPEPFPAAGAWIITTLMFSWSITEIIRYSFYAFKQVGFEPYILLYLRYTTFLVLYITGVSSELGCVWYRLSWIEKNRPFSVVMPNSWNWAFDSYWFTIGFVLAYIPFFPMLYGHMLAQRRTQLGPKKVKSQ
jgi:very-long-chain (3R)-3-hydroxyacyl-CoA dehydratase